MEKPSNIQLRRNLFEILKIESTVKEVKNLSIKNKVPLKCYQSLKISTSRVLNDLYTERSILLSTYKQSMKAYLDWQWKQEKENHIQKQKDFESLVSTMTDNDRALLKTFWHKL